MICYKTAGSNFDECELVEETNKSYIIKLSYMKKNVIIRKNSKEIKIVKSFDEAKDIVLEAISKRLVNIEKMKLFNQERFDIITNSKTFKELDKK
jgi:hypothetical protein